MAPTIRGPGYVGGVIARGAQGQFPDRFCLKTKCRFMTHATKSYLPRMVTRGYYVKQNDTHGYSELCCKTSIRGCNKLLLCITTVKLVHKIMRVFYSHCFAFQYACNTQCVASGGMFCHVSSVCQKRHDIMRSDGSTWEFHIPSSYAFSVIPGHGDLDIYCWFS